MSFGNDVHLMTGSLMIPSNALSANDTILARWDDLVENTEEVIIAPLTSAVYTLNPMMPMAAQVFDCLGTSVAEEANADAIHAWPNPFTESFTLRNASSSTRIIAMNALGQCVYDGPYHEAMGAAWPAGVYTIAVISDRASAKVVLVKQ